MVEMGVVVFHLGQNWKRVFPKYSLSPSLEKET